MRIDSNDKLLKFPLIHFLIGLEFSRYHLRLSYANPNPAENPPNVFPALGADYA